jgi:adenylylsulfate kinase
MRAIAKFEMANSDEKNIVRHAHLVDPDTRAAALGQTGRVLWFTGLSGSGKSTLAMALEARLLALGKWAFVLDGDNMRHGLCGDLGFSPEDRTENLRRIGHVCALMADGGLYVLAAFVSPGQAMRDGVKDCVGASRFDVIHVSTPLAVCEERDPKGLYVKARTGEIAGFTGISAPYEPPRRPTLAVDTSLVTVEAAVDQLIELLRVKGTKGKRD